MEGSWSKLLVLLVVLACLATAFDLKRPKCRSAVNCEEHTDNIFDDSFFYYVNGSGGYKEKQQILVKHDKNKKSLEICCSCRQSDVYMVAVDDPALPAMPTPTIINSLEFTGCLVPHIPYHEAIRALNFTFLCDNCVLKLTELPAQPRLEGYHFKGLVLKELRISAGKINPPTRPKKDFLNELQNLKILILNSGVEPEEEVRTLLPKSLESVSLYNTRLLLPSANATETQDDGNDWLTRLHSLKHLHLAEQTTKLPKILVALPPPASFSKLMTLVLNRVPLAPTMLDNSKWLKDSNLQQLTIIGCGLEKLPNNFFEGANITKINFQNNILRYLPNDVFAPLSSSLRELDLSHNRLGGRDLVRAVQSLEQLQVLKVTNNPLDSLCSSKESSMLPQNLRFLNLSQTRATQICTDWIENDFLLKIYLDGNKIQKLWYSDLRMRRAENKSVLLSLQNNISPVKIVIDEKDYQKCVHDSTMQNGGTRKRVRVNLLLNSFECDCKAHWLGEMLESCPLLKPYNVKCMSPQGATKIFVDYRENLFCPCPTGCSCQKREPDNAVVVQCKGPLPQAPSWPRRDDVVVLHVAPGTLGAIPVIPHINLRELHAPNNNITNIAQEDISATLRVLDVRNNSIRHITLGAAQALQRLSGQDGYNVSLFGNPLACECEDERAIKTLQRAKISDWDMTKCVDQHFVADKRTLCSNNPSRILPILLGVTGALLVFTIAALTLLYLRPRIKQFLFDQGMCLHYVLNIKDVDDPMKTHDVFISYSQADLESAKILIAKLEEHGHSTIEHNRDWTPGENITRQITHSVIAARRTLLLVSDNYANSERGLEEFHAAHAHAMERGSARVIVVLCEIQSIEKLPDDLRLYLKNNTYLDWSDRYFWDKMWRVMPQPRVTPLSTIALVPHKNLLPDRGKQIIADPTLLISRLSLDRDPPLSELVLVPPVQRSHDGSPELSGKDSPVTPVVTEPPQLGVNKYNLPSNI